jgi:hypothetical protein
MKRLILICTALVTALTLPTAASAWDDVDVTVAFPQRVTTGRAITVDFHVTLAHQPLDLATVGLRDPSPRPTVVFRKHGRQVTAVARRTLHPGVYRLRVVLSSLGGWRYTFQYDGLVRSGKLGAVRATR